MDDCVFCRIVGGVKEEDVVWEDDEFLAILDINPCARGHLMVIPKVHSRWVWDMGDEEYLRYMGRVRFLANVLRKAFGTDCVQSAIVGMDVAHAHVHLYPLVEGGEFKGIPVAPIEPKPSEEEMVKIREKIKGSL